MKILVIHGSMRKGNTYALTKKIIDRLSAKPDVDITEISVSELDLPFCQSCHLCFERGEEHCPHYGVMKNIESALIDSDGIIVSGTTYIWSINAALKNLLDHLAYLFHRPSLFGKKGMVIATSAGVGEKGVAKYLKTVLGQWGINGALLATQTAKEREMVSPVRQALKIDSAAEQFYHLIKRGKPTPPSIKAIAVHNAFRAMSLGAYTGSERDTQHWQQSGYKDKAYPVKAGALKYMFGSLVYGVVNLSVKVIERSLKK